MILAAQKQFSNGPTFSTTLPDQPVDYVVASGIFNVKMGVDEKTWKAYIQASLQAINQMAIKGLSFNILTSYSDLPFQKDYLYYAQPEDWFSYCKKHFSPRVALLHDYPLYEFCLIIRK
jgi:hypothetical protein